MVGFKIRERIIKVVGIWTFFHKSKLTKTINDSDSVTLEIYSCPLYSKAQWNAKEVSFFYKPNLHCRVSTFDGKVSGLIVLTLGIEVRFTLQFSLTLNLLLTTQNDGHFGVRVHFIHFMS